MTPRNLLRRVLPNALQLYIGGFVFIAGIGVGAVWMMIAIRVAFKAKGIL